MTFFAFKLKCSNNKPATTKHFRISIFKYTLPPKSLHTPISVYAIKHACYSGLGEGQGEGRHLCKLGAFLTKL